MYAALLSGCLFAAALVPAVPLNAARSPSSRITWTGLYDEKGRPVTFEELRDHKFPPDADKYGNCPGGTLPNLLPTQFGPNGGSMGPMGRSRSKIRGTT